MKTSTLKNFLTRGALITALAVLAGCASKSYDKGAATANALGASSEAAAKASTQIYDVLGTLNMLATTSQGDLRGRYDAFVKAAGKLDKATAKLDAKVIALQSATTNYLADWTNRVATIQNADLRQQSLQRNGVVANELNDVTTSYQGVKSQLQAFSTNVKDIQTYLGTDLTAAGLASVKDTVNKAKLEVLPLRDSIKQLQKNLTELSTALSPVLPAPAGQ